MPKYKIAVFSTVLTAFAVLLVLSIVMTWPRYQKTTEILPSMISESSSNEALLQIRAQLDEASAKTGTDEETGTVTAMWTGSVCGAKYRTLSGQERYYYVCPYILAETTDLSGGDTAVWTMALHFAVSALKDGTIAEIEDRIDVKDIHFSFRVRDDRQITRAGFGDGEMSDVRDLTVSYQFRDRNAVNSASSAVAKLEVTGVNPSEIPDVDIESLLTEFELSGIPTNTEFLLEKLEEYSEENPTESSERFAVLNWSFVICEENHVIGNFDDVQMDFPYPAG